jgi:hypothetical protein
MLYEETTISLPILLAVKRLHTFMYNYYSIKFYENVSGKSCVVTCKQTDSDEANTLNF